MNRYVDFKYIYIQCTVMICHPFRVGFVHEYPIIVEYTERLQNYSNNPHIRFEKNILPGRKHDTPEIHHLRAYTFQPIPGPEYENRPANKYQLSNNCKFFLIKHS